MIIDLETLNIYTFSLLAVPAGLIGGYLRSPTIFLVLLEAIFVAGSLATIYPVWLPLPMGLLVGLVLFEEYSGGKTRASRR